MAGIQKGEIKANNAQTRQSTSNTIKFDSDYVHGSEVAPISQDIVGDITGGEIGKRVLFFSNKNIEPTYSGATFIKRGNESYLPGDLNIIEFVFIGSGKIVYGYKKGITTIVNEVIQPTNIGSNSFTANWDAVTNAQEYRIDVSRDNFVTFEGIYDNFVVSNTLTSLDISGLRTGDTYKYRVRAIVNGVATDNIIYPAVILLSIGNRVANSEDWEDINDDGIPDAWEFTAGLSVSTVINNGFDGGALRFEATATGPQSASIESVNLSNDIAYTLWVKYRSSVNFDIKGNEDSNFTSATVAANLNDAIWFGYSGIKTSGNNVGIKFEIPSASIGDWVEIDSVSLRFEDVETLPPPTAFSSSINGVDGSQIDFSWEIRTYQEEGFEIWQSIDQINWVLAKTVGSSITSTSISGFANNTYYFRIRSFKNDKFSEFTNFISETIIGETEPGEVKITMDATDKEIEQWQIRMINGPYKTQGDAGMTFSPGDWDRIKSNADKFLADPVKYRWIGEGITPGSCVLANPTSSAFVTEPQTGDSDLQIIAMRDAAFVYLLTKDTTYGDLVKSELYNFYRTNPKFDFSDTSTWCVDETKAAFNPHFFIASGLSIILRTYDYVKDRFTSAERTNMDTWFLNIGNHFNDSINATLSTFYTDLNLRPDSPFIDPSRMAGEATEGGIDSEHRTHQDINGNDGFLDPFASQLYNNRRAYYTVLVGLIGVFLNNSTFKTQAKAWFKEFVKYYCYPDGTTTEYRRSRAAYPDRGFGYTQTVIGMMSELAATFGRDGDTSLLEYTTSDGIADTLGGPKSLLQVITTISKYYDNTVLVDADVRRNFPRYFPGFAGQEKYKIDDIKSWKTTNETFVYDMWSALVNGYYKDENIKQGYLRIKSGTRKYTPPFSYPGRDNPWGGVHSAFPGMLFMYGNMENIVNPYNTVPQPPATQPVSQPTALSLTATSGNIEGTFTVSDAEKYLVVYRSDAATTFVPVDNSVYSKGQVVGDGIVGAIVTQGSFSITGLSGGTVYHVSIFAFNDSTDGTVNYLTTSPLIGNIQTTVGGTMSTEIINTSPYLFWDFGESSGTTAVDSSGNSRDGVYENSPGLGVASLVTNDDDKAVSFSDTADNRVVRTEATEFTLPAKWAVMFVCKVESNGSRAIFTIGKPDNNTPKIMFATENATPGDQLRILIRDDAGTQINLFSNAAIFTSGKTETHRVYFGIDNGAYELKIDDALDKTGSITYGAITLKQFTVGSLNNNGSWSTPIDGIVDKLAFWQTTIPTLANFVTIDEAGTY